MLNIVPSSKAVEMEKSFIDDDARVDATVATLYLTTPSQFRKMPVGPCVWGISKPSVVGATPSVYMKRSTRKPLLAEEIKYRHVRGQGCHFFFPARDLDQKPDSEKRRNETQ